MRTSTLKPALLFLLATFSIQIKAQSDQDKHAQLKSLIDSKKYLFNALSASSLRGKTFQLTGEYFLKMNQDSLIVDLPYYGRSYSSDYPATDLSIRFKTNQFTYTSDTTKKGGWNITIIPKSQPRATKIFMSVSSSGYCNMSINSNSRETISFYGTILPSK